jgi:hypothetical protein
MKRQIITHSIALVVGFGVAWLVLEYRDTTKPIEVNPDQYRIEERIKIEREQIKPLQDSLSSSLNEIERLKKLKPKTRIIYKNKQNENTTLSDSASLNLLRERLRAVELP